MSNPEKLVQKLWNYCSIVHDDGLSCGDYIEQLAFSDIAKNGREQSQPKNSFRLLNSPLHIGANA